MFPFGICGLGGARHPGPTPLPQHIGVEVFNVRGWLTHGYSALEVGVDFLAVVEHRLIPVGVLLVVIVGILWLDALLLLLLLFFPARFSLVVGLLFILLLGLFLTVAGGHLGLLSLSRALLFGRPLGCLLLIKSRSSKSVEVQRVWEVYDERLQFISRQDLLLLDESLEAGDVSRVRLVWSGAAETALADAFRFCVLFLAGGWFLGVVVLCLGLSGLVVTRCGRLVAMFLMRMMMLVSSCIVNSSIAPLLDMRRRLKAFVSLARSVELTAQWDRIVVGPLCLVTLDDLSAVRGLGLGEFHRVVSDIHHRLSEFIHAVVVHRRDEAFRVWRNRIREDALIHPWLRPDLVPPAPFLQCQPHFTHGGSGVLADPARIDEEFQKAWLPYFCRCGQREASVHEFDREVDGWLPILPEVHLPRLTGQMLADVVQRKGATAGGLDCWCWRSLRFFLFHGVMSWLVFLPRLRMLVFGLMGCWMLILP